MPDPEENAKPRDTHPPQSGNAGPAADTEADEVESTPGLGENQAGFLKDREGTGAGRDRNYR